jgi:hypothetical protein
MEKRYTPIARLGSGLRRIPLVVHVAMVLLLGLSVIIGVATPSGANTASFTGSNVRIHYLPHPGTDNECNNTYPNGVPETPDFSTLTGLGQTGQTFSYAIGWVDDPGMVCYGSEWDVNTDCAWLYGTDVNTGEPGLVTDYYLGEADYFPC